MRLTNRDSGVVVNVRDDKPDLGPAWVPADAMSAGTDDKTCETCGFVAKSKAGLGAHQRSH